MSIVIVASSQTKPGAILYLMLLPALLVASATVSVVVTAIGLLATREPDWTAVLVGAIGGGLTVIYFCIAVAIEAWK
jgi:hypothetical protein